MVNVQLFDLGTTWLAPGQTAGWIIGQGTNPNFWGLVTANPMYRNTELMITEQRTSMDGNGYINLTYWVKNIGANAGLSWEHELRVDY
jgi:hypothetical protein